MPDACERFVRVLAVALSPGSRAPIDSNSDLQKPTLENRDRSLTSARLMNIARSCVQVASKLFGMSLTNMSVSKESHLDVVCVAGGS